MVLGSMGGAKHSVNRMTTIMNKSRVVNYGELQSLLPSIVDDYAVAVFQTSVSPAIVVMKRCYTSASIGDDEMRTDLDAKKTLHA